MNFYSTVLCMPDTFCFCENTIMVATARTVWLHRYGWFWWCHNVQQRFLLKRARTTYGSAARSIASQWSGTANHPPNSGNAAQVLASTTVAQISLQYSKVSAPRNWVHNFQTDHLERYQLVVIVQARQHGVFATRRSTVMSQEISPDGSPTNPANSALACRFRRFRRLRDCLRFPMDRSL